MAGDKINNEIKRIKLIDPNDFTNQYAGSVFSDTKFNMSVPPEDLCVVVELSTYGKGRTVLSSSKINSSSTITNQRINVSFNNNEIINLMTFSSDATTGNKPTLTTKYTDLSTQLDTIDEALGLTSIDIDFNSSYTPMVTINFIDVKGGAIFQQNGQSKYSIFFRLPYPLFQLKIKGFYGKPVTYCLHLTKFNSKFNSQTGNFEITAHFVGYTYALLSDMIIGYLKAAEETPRGKTLLAERKSTSKNLLSINEFLQAIPLIDNAIKEQLSSSNQDATTLTTYQQAENYLNNLNSEVQKFISNLQQSFPNNLVSSPTNNDIVVINPNTIVTSDIIKQKVQDFTVSFQNLVVSYNKLSTSSSINLIANLGPIVSQFTPSQLSAQPISSQDSITIQGNYKDYNVSDILQVNNVVKRLNDSIPNSIITTSLFFIDVTDVFSSINNQLSNITLQEKDVEKELGQQLYGKIKDVLKFDPNIRNITNIFTTGIEIFLQLIYETATHWNDSARLAQFSKFKNSIENIDVTKTNIVNNLVFPFPEYHNVKDEEQYLGYPGVLTNPEQVPEIQLVNQLYDGMIIGNKILQNINNTVNGPAAWNSMNPIDSYKFQTTIPYSRLPSSTGPNDLAAYVVMRAAGFLGFSNTFLSADGIKTFASADAQALINNFNNNFNIINALLDNYKLGTDYLNAAALINGNNTKVLISEGGYNFNGTTIPSSLDVYSYISEHTTNRYVLPTDKNFFGENLIYSLTPKNGTVSSEPSNLLLSSRICDTPDLTNIIDTATYVTIIEKTDYDSIIITPANNYTSNAFNVEKLRHNIKEDIQTTPTELIACGFNAGYGKYGIQDFTQADYSSTNDMGLNNVQPFYSIFYSNAVSGNITTPNLTGGRRVGGEPLFTSYDLYVDNTINDFTTQDSNYINELFGNQVNPGQNLQSFQNSGNLSSVAFPFFGYAISTLKNATNIVNQAINIIASVVEPVLTLVTKLLEGDTVDGKRSFSTFQSLFGSRFYNAQGVQARAYLFLHCFPWRGLVGGVYGETYYHELVRLFAGTPVNYDPLATGPFNTIPIRNTFRYRTGFVQVPKLFPAFIGAIIWRYEKAGLEKDGKTTFTSLLTFDDSTTSGKDPITFTASTKTSYLFPSNINNYPKSYQYCLSNQSSDFQYAMSFSDDTDGYYNIEPLIINLPSPVKQVFLDEFINFVNGNNNFSNDQTGFPQIQQLFEVYPLKPSTPSISAWDTSYNSIADVGAVGTININNIVANIGLNPINPSYQDPKAFLQSNYKVFTYFSNIPGSYVIEYVQNGVLDNKLKSLFFDYKYIANCSWRIWQPNFTALFFTPTITQQWCDAHVYIQSSDFNNYIAAFTAEITSAKNANDKQYFNNKNLLEIKFEIYRTLKKIYDKWIANSTGPTNSIFQCCTTGAINGLPTRLAGDTNINKHLGGEGINLNLIDSFRFINRAFVDIGDDLPINPIAFGKILADSTDTSFYDMFGRLLTDNNLIFVPLPTYIDYSNNAEVESIFKSYPYYLQTEITTSGPSFVCMYVGQTSTKLDFGPNSDYPDDGINFNDKSKIPTDLASDLSDHETPTAAFLVKYGQQNQNIFKDIVLDQAEFTETAESLRITDAIANSYSQTNQSYVGQNLYNVYTARSYKAEVTMMGNAMIQPMMYFQLDNIPMFRGAYLITGVKHHIVPNSMSTVFTGVRVKKTATPLIEASTLYTSLLQGYQLPTGTTNTISSTYTNYVFKYQNILKQAVLTSKTIQNSPTITSSQTAAITLNAQKELTNWQNGTLSETSDAGGKLVKKYTTKQGMYNFSQSVNSPSDPWSAVFVSYIMTFGDEYFPASASHYDYITNSITNTKYGYEVFPLKAGLTIKAEIGDIIVNPRSGNFTASHGNIIWSITNNTANLIGGNRGLSSGNKPSNTVNFKTQETEKNDGTVKSTQITLTNGYITDATDVGTALLIMKKTKGTYYQGINPLINYSVNAPGNNVNFTKPTSQQTLQYQIQIKNYFKNYFKNSYNIVLNDDTSKILTAGIMGNLQQESGFNPNIAPHIDSNKEYVYGLIQWNAGTYSNIPSTIGLTVDSQLNALVGGYTPNFNVFMKNALGTTNGLNASYAAFLFANKVEICAACSFTDKVVINGKTHYILQPINQQYTQYLAGDNNIRSKNATIFYNKFNTTGDPLQW